jgi:hypothetical protein
MHNSDQNQEGSAHTRIQRFEAQKMQQLVVWWCELIGVSDGDSIRVATGIIAGGSLILAAIWIVNTISFFLGADGPRRGSS